MSSSADLVIELIERRKSGEEMTSGRITTHTGKEQNRTERWSPGRSNLSISNVVENSGTVRYSLACWSTSRFGARSDYTVFFL